MISLLFLKTLFIIHYNEFNIDNLKLALKLIPHS
jgi:hypothetical protein